MQIEWIGTWKGFARFGFGFFIAVLTVGLMSPSDVIPTWLILVPMICMWMCAEGGWKQ